MEYLVLVLGDLANEILFLFHIQSCSNLTNDAVLESNAMIPQFIPHECKSESNCQVCKNYVNMLDNYRQWINKKIIVPDKLPKIKRLFSLPSPYFVKT